LEEALVEYDREEEDFHFVKEGNDRNGNDGNGNDEKVKKKKKRKSEKASSLTREM